MMTKQNIKKLNKLLEDVAVDKLAVVSLENLNDTLLRDKVENLLPHAKSIIVMAMEIFPEVVRHLTSKAQRGEMALRDLYDRNVEVVNGLLDWQAYTLVKKLHSLGFKGLILPAGGSPSDERFLSGAISYKHLAQIAGLGVFGWNSLLITPEYGSRIRLACVITDASLKPSSSVEEYMPCVKCGGACVKVCPARAIRKPRGNEQYAIDKYACSTYYTASGGCAECLKVCPAGKHPGKIPLKSPIK